MSTVQPHRSGSVVDRLVAAFTRVIRRYGVIFTVLGAIITAIGALYSNERQQLRSEATILRHLYCELDDNINDQLFVALTGEPLGFGPDPIYTLPRVEFWSAVTGGALQNITDTRLTFLLSQAYSDIKDLRQFVELYRSTLLAPAAQSEGIQNIAGSERDMRLLRSVIIASSQKSRDRIVAAQEALREWFASHEGTSRAIWWLKELSPIEAKDCRVAR